MSTWIDKVEKFLESDLSVPQQEADFVLTDIQNKKADEVRRQRARESAAKLSKYKQRQVGFCNTCAWYLRYKYDEAVKDKMRGQCRLNAPQVMPEHTTANWPTVERWDFCGQYEYRYNIYRGDDPISPMRK